MDQLRIDGQQSHRMRHAAAPIRRVRFELSESPEKIRHGRLLRGLTAPSSTLPRRVPNADMPAVASARGVLIGGSRDVACEN
jgi:hypothetical protein